MSNLNGRLSRLEAQARRQNDLAGVKLTDSAWRDVEDQLLAFNAECRARLQAEEARRQAEGLSTWPDLGDVPAPADVHRRVELARARIG